MLFRLSGALVMALLLPLAAYAQADKGTLLGTVLDGVAHHVPTRRRLHFRPPASRFRNTSTMCGR